jgi:hypothetical protein
MRTDKQNSRVKLLLIRTLVHSWNRTIPAVIYPLTHNTRRVRGIRPFFSGIKRQRSGGERLDPTCYLQRCPSCRRLAVIS